MTLRDLMARLDELRGEVGPDAEVMVIDGDVGITLTPEAIRAEGDGVWVDLTHATCEVI